MSEELVREIANQVLREGIYKNGWLYLLLALMLVISGVVSTMLSMYFRRRPDDYATKADLSELIALQKEASTTTDQVKSALAKMDWVEREWRILRREKLEELISAAHSARHWLGVEKGALFFDGTPNSGPSPIWRLEMLTTLYFPELENEARKLTTANGMYQYWMLDVAQALNAAGQDLARKNAIRAERLFEHGPHHQRVIDAISAIDARASSLMREIAGV